MTAPLVVASPDEVTDVTFDRSMEVQIERTLQQYPDSGAALLPILWLCQERWGWISPGIMEAVGKRLDLAPAFVEGVVSFYTMYQRRPPGKYLLQVCTTLSCQLCETSVLVDYLKRRLCIDFGETSGDGLFTLVDVQCLGACGEAPVIQINSDYHTDLTVQKLDALLDRLAGQ
ncbi:MAG: NAD(P)H-dependent oxidoreductase subunit E [Acidobacteriota bacterium]|jgi:NADH-quinone oxidoreductase E subunit|nr:NAD(P)H-dependent oxidoreductase subunit E [Acidobacteriota bacterium]